MPEESREPLWKRYFSWRYSVTNTIVNLALPTFGAAAIGIWGYLKEYSGPLAVMFQVDPIGWAPNKVD